MKYDAIVIGCGMSGILAGIHLKNSGKKFIILEKAETLGGTWRDNTYPGLTCDVPSHAYTYSFEPNPEWSRVLPPGGEIQQWRIQTRSATPVDSVNEGGVLRAVDQQFSVHSQR